eukprot:3900733-Rhodomonas_salina.2
MIHAHALARDTKKSRGRLAMVVLEQPLVLTCRSRCRRMFCGGPVEAFRPRRASRYLWRILCEPTTRRAVRQIVPLDARRAHDGARQIDPTDPGDHPELHSPTHRHPHPALPGLRHVCSHRGRVVWDH